MDKIFAYDSKIMQILLKLSDMMIMNILFIILCIPIITIGAAQSALYAGLRQLMNKEDDTSCTKAFFKAFTNGFWKITVVHTVFLIIMFLFVLVLYGTLVYSNAQFTVAAWMCVIVLAICVLFHSMLAPFHASFDCTAWQLAKNMYFVVMAFFFRAIIVAILVWLPIIVAVIDLYFFMYSLLVWGVLYYSFAYLLAYSLMKKPFEDLKQEFLQQQKAALPDASAQPKETE